MTEELLIGDGDVRRLVAGLYRSLLNREPDADGLNLNVGYLLQNRQWNRLEDLIRQFVDCNEARQLRGEPINTPDHGDANHHVRYMDWDDIGRSADAWKEAAGAVGSSYDEFRGKYLPLPPWFQTNLDPLSPEYFGQQDRLWRLMTGSEVKYDPRTAELTMDDLNGPIARTGIHSSASNVAADHLIALGHLVKHSNIRPGDRVLEYGAGRGDIAASFARLGAEVHTIDIDPNFCAFVSRLARFYDVSLTAHRAEFGDNPAGGKYSLIYFYEAFHHSRDFPALIASFKDNLAPGGKVLMAGEPIVPSSNPMWKYTCPYPWGIRLEAEVASIVRLRGWYELGFTQEFLSDLFSRNGFTYRVHPSNISEYAVVHEFQLA